MPASEYEAARVLLRYLRDRVRDLDRDLPPAAQAEVCAEAVVSDLMGKGCGSSY